ncbi:MAG: deoxyguanosinetriphosphate triphosphohydrolase [Lachnospiraceae bacterium]
MTIREMTEQREEKSLSPYAAKSSKSIGREQWEEPCEIRPIYQRDRDRILHCKSFRRLKHKTQVFLSPKGDHYRTRLTHTLEVSQNARTIARALRLNEDLTEAIALGHDLGHTPFGHAGERALNQVCSHGFRHYEQSRRVVERIEKDGKGLNLSWEVRDGIMNHQISTDPATLEGKIVRLSDKIAYINHDIDDAIRAGILKETDLPKEYVEILGDTTRKRLNSMILDIVYSSQDKNDIVVSEEVYSAMMGMRKFMFEHVYTNELAKSEEQKAVSLVQQLFDYYLHHPDQMPDEYINMLKEGEEHEVVVCDYIAGMTDNYAIQQFQSLYVPKGWGR